MRFRYGERVHRAAARGFPDRLRHASLCSRKGHYAALTLEPVDCRDCLAQPGASFSDVTAEMIAAQA